MTEEESTIQICLSKLSKFLFFTRWLYKTLTMMMYPGHIFFCSC